MQFLLEPIFMNNVFWISSYNDPKRIALIIISIAIHVKRLFIGQFIIQEIRGRTKIIDL